MKCGESRTYPVTIMSLLEKCIKKNSCLCNMKQTSPDIILILGIGKTYVAPDCLISCCHCKHKNYF